MTRKEFLRHFAGLAGDLPTTPDVVRSEESSGPDDGNRPVDSRDDE